MGQYYNPIILGKKGNSIKGYFYSHSYGNGLKLMEHSYLRNNFVAAVMTYLNREGGARLVWAGDYADKEPDTLKISKEKALPIWQKKVSEGTLTCSFNEFYASNDEVLYDEKNEGADNLYGLCTRYVTDDGKLIHAGRPEIKIADEDINKDFRFIVNTTKKQVIDLWDVKGFDGWQIHPLPLLTAEGNDRGGGDYRGTNMKLVGTWARDFISVPTEVDYTYLRSLQAKGYEIINPLFAETYSINRAADLLVDAYTNLKEELNLSRTEGEHIKKTIKGLRDILKEPKEETPAPEPALAEA